MYELVANRGTARGTRDELWASLSKGAKTVQQVLKTPAATFTATVLVRKDLNLWAFLDDKPFQGHYNFWLGVGEPTTQAAIEINIPVKRTLHNAGQLVRDAAGRVHLAHRGGLGGGKFSVAVDAFADIIEGFDLDEVVEGKRPIVISSSGRQVIARC